MPQLILSSLDAIDASNPANCKWLLGDSYSYLNDATGNIALTNAILVNSQKLFRPNVMDYLYGFYEDYKVDPVLVRINLAEIVSDVDADLSLATLVDVFNGDYTFNGSVNPVWEYYNTGTDEWTVLGAAWLAGSAIADYMTKTIQFIRNLEDRTGAGGRVLRFPSLLDVDPFDVVVWASANAFVVAELSQRRILNRLGILGSEFFLILVDDSLASDAEENFGTIATTNEATYSVNLITNSFVDVICPSVRSDQMTSAKRGNVMARFYVDVPYGQMYTYAPQISNPIKATLKDLTQMELRLIDEYGDQIVLPPNQVVSYTFNLDIQQRDTTLY